MYKNDVSKCIKMMSVNGPKMFCFPRVHFCIKRTVVERLESLEYYKMNLFERVSLNECTYFKCRA
jgi:hypothetical protein